MAKIITFDGHDGTGKSTVALLLNETLQSRGHNTIILSPVQGFMNNFRKKNLSVASDIWFYFAAWLLLEKRIELIGATYDYILVDRSYNSTIVLARVKNISFPNTITDCFLKPDLAIWIHVDEPARLERLAQKKFDKIDNQTRDNKLIERANLEYEKLNLIKVFASIPPEQIVKNLLNLLP